MRSMEHFCFTVSARGVLLFLHLIKRDNDGLFCEWQKEKDYFLLFNLQSQSQAETLLFFFP